MTFLSLFTSEALVPHAKGIVIVLVWISGFVGVLLPLRWHRGGRRAVSEERMSQATCFAVGVILAVALCHLLPDSSKAFEKSTEFPLANCLAGLGLLIVVMVEKALIGPHEAIVGHIGTAHGQSSQLDLNTWTTYGTISGVDVADCADAKSNCDRPPGDAAAGKKDQHDCGLRGHHHHVQYGSKVFRQGLHAGVSLTQHIHSDKAGVHCGDEGDEVSADLHRTIDVKLEEKPIGSWVALTVFVVLSFHSVVEGLALGSAQDPRAVMMIAVAILAHKFLAAASLGISFVKASLPVGTHTTWGFLFSLATPFGALLGALLMNLMALSDLEVFSAVCQSLGAGTFLYVALLEFLPEEINTGGGVGTKLALATLGYANMSIVALWL
eukprot:TRINITY_DN1459_c2_g1_i1.p1 TRINITY_DN1459_c2_g1~~TRINITY_DN1459_c2_g1_i1.p1  ORF type:complete len:382 (+),score=141.74 TRINITY_DN1459_c2_g1_i1:96-1241(+)